MAGMIKYCKFTVGKNFFLTSELSITRLGHVDFSCTVIMLISILQVIRISEYESLYL